MDKKKLNNEIVLCRPIVKKAKVIVIRKILKKMKVLKSCKKEAVKDKKLKKAERLFKKVQILKKLKVDDVTKFALRNKDFNASTKKMSKNLKFLAFSSLAKYDLLAKKIESIREQVPNWEIELPLLLDSIGKKKKNKKTIANNVKSTTFLKSSDEKPSSQVEIKEDTVKLKKDEEIKNTPEEDVKLTENSGTSDENSNDLDLQNVFKVKKDKQINNSIKHDLKITDSHKAFKKKEVKNFHSESDENPSESDSESDDFRKNEEPKETEKLIKIDDPFFVGKKMIASKLLLEEEPKQPPKKFESKIFKNSQSFNFDTKPFRNKFDFDRKRNFRDRESFNFNDKPFHRKFDVDNVKYKQMKNKESEPQENLHPSWEAKRNQKNQLVKPFQGKKIKFSDD